MKYKLSKYITFSDSFNQGGKERVIIYSTRSNKSAVIDSLILNKIINNDFSCLNDELINTFFSMELLIPKEEDEFTEILNQNVINLKNETSLSLTVQPSSNCQLGCHYCAQVHSKNNMSDDVYHKLISRIRDKISTGKYKDLSIMWYGGEPLKAFSTIRSFSKEIISIASNNSINYDSMMITNGLSLKPNIFKELYLEHKVHNFQITLDGNAEFHDKRRVTKIGRKATFNIILNNIIEITKLDIYQSKVKKPILIRINIDKTNYNGVFKLLDILVENNLQDKVSIEFAPVVDWGEKKFGTSEGYTKKEFAEIEIDLLLHLYKLGFHNFKDILPERTSSPCMVVSKDSAEVIDAYGNLYPCYEFTYTPTHSEDKYKIGNILEDNFTPNNSAITRNWYEDIKKGDLAYCNKCEFFPICGGGCVKNWYIEDDNIGCPTFKFNFKDRLVIDYLSKNNALI